MHEALKLQVHEALKLLVYEDAALIQCLSPNTTCFTQQAEELFTTAIQLKPWDGGLYQAFAVLLHASGNLQRARMLFQQGSKAAKVLSLLALLVEKYKY